ncbi:anti-anti-sigma factor [Saccharothrix tamanrassetensis]|uniref:Anti-sigma factor antagonist n=1 Tax=Saccharothrix tamanrassetensis TaxID=1051531 RepID=A0A841CLK2_9PSEU|nr:STAS domain-containing protein [Saccharothrix tamanrassetensis]MBB5957980.1 anti-anti-sigma factor [Saccharothrix tamanrassetensis]
MGDTCTETSPATTIRVDLHDGTAVVRVTGEIDMACEKPVRAAIFEQLHQRPAGLVVDLTGIDFFGSTGIQLLVEAIAHAQRLGVALAVATDRRAVLRPLEITHMSQAVVIYPTVQAGLDALRADGVRADGVRAARHRSSAGVA